MQNVIRVSLIKSFNAGHFFKENGGAYGINQTSFNIHYPADVSWKEKVDLIKQQILEKAPEVSQGDSHFSMFGQQSISGGTRKGIFILDPDYCVEDSNPKSWDYKGPFLKAVQVSGDAKLEIKRLEMLLLGKTSNAVEARWVKANSDEPLTYKMLYREISAGL